jgi:hypothetical protein
VTYPALFVAFFITWLGTISWEGFVLLIGRVGVWNEYELFDVNECYIRGLQDITGGNSNQERAALHDYQHAYRD